MIDEIYSDFILELNKNPANKKRISGVSYRDKNLFCGDEIEIILNVDNSGKIIDVGWQGNGCAISQASASLLTENIKGKNVRDALNIEIIGVLNELGTPHLNNNPIRIKCAMLPLKAMKMAAFIHLSKKNLNNA